jgi:hypothetical protein
MLKFKFVLFISNALNLNDLQNDKQTQKFIERELNFKVSPYGLRVDKLKKFESIS